MPCDTIYVQECSHGGFSRTHLVNEPVSDVAAMKSPDDYFALHRERVEGFLTSALEGLYTAQPTDPLDFIGRVALAQAGAAVNSHRPEPRCRAASECRCDCGAPGAK